MSKSPQLLIVGVSDSVMNVTSGHFACAAQEIVRESTSFFEKLETMADGTYNAVLIGAAIADLPALGLAQSLRMQLPHTKIFFLCGVSDALPPADLVKNGCNEFFLFPLDLRHFKRAMRTALATTTQETELLAVPAEDLAQGTNVDFDVSVFLPMNKRYVKILKSGDSVRERPGKDDMKQIFVAEKDIERFVKYSREAHKHHGGSRYEQQQRRVGQLRDLYHDLIMSSPTLNFEDGKELVARARKLAEEIARETTGANPRREVVIGLNEGDFDACDRALRFAQTASTLARSLQTMDPVEAALASLLMDIGKLVLPLDPSNEDLERHSLESVRVLQERKMILPPTVLDAIAQHHERYDGKGFPKHLAGGKISEGGELLYLVDRLLEQNLISAGRKLRSFEEIVDALSADPGVSPRLSTAIKGIASSGAA